MSKQTRIRVAFAIAAATVVAARLYMRGEDPSPKPTSATTRNLALDEAIAHGREQLEAVRAAARAEQPERKIVSLPVQPGLPAWATHLTTQPNPELPTPRGSE